MKNTKNHQKSIFQENHVKNTKNTAYSHVIVTVTLKYRVNCGYQSSRKHKYTLW